MKTSTTPITTITILAALVLVSSAHAFSGKKSPAPAESDPVVMSDGANVWVVRADGAKSCSPGTGQTLEAAQSDLLRANVHVLDARKGSDGKLHAMYCGGVAGSANTYLIPRTDLPAALAIGFQEKRP